MNVLVFLIWTVTLGMTTGAKILGVFMMDMFSHFNFNNAIMEVLATNGHEVTVISPFIPKDSLTNITYIQTRKETAKHPSSWSKIDFKQKSLWQTYKPSPAIFIEACERFTKLPETRDIFSAKTKKFDLMFVGMIVMWECYLPAASRLNIPLIGSSPTDLRFKQLPVLGNPFPLSTKPHTFSTSISKMTFFERLKNTIEIMYLDFIHFMLINPPMERFYQTYYPNEDPRAERISLLFLNSYGSIFPEPHVPGIIEIAGIHLRPPKPLPANLETFILEAEHGVILFSLGTVATAKDLTAEIRQIFKSVFAKIPQRVIWKFGEKIDGISDNVMILDWVPQLDVLAQENVVLFISHAGKSSATEAVYTGTPILAVPLFFDQFSNARNMKESGVGLVLDLSTLTVASLLNSIQEILQNKNYQDRMKKLSQAFKDRPMSPKETVLYWTEYVLRHNGTKHLQTAAINMPFYQYLLLDVICFMIFSTIIILLFLMYLMKKICGFNFFNTKKVNVKMTDEKIKT